MTSLESDLTAVRKCLPLYSSLPPLASPCSMSVKLKSLGHLWAGPSPPQAPVLWLEEPLEKSWPESWHPSASPSVCLSLSPIFLCLSLCLFLLTQECLSPCLNSKYANYSQTQPHSMTRTCPSPPASRQSWIQGSMFPSCHMINR